VNFHPFRRLQSAPTKTKLNHYWQGRFFDYVLRVVKEYQKKAGLVSRAEEWQWSSVMDCTEKVMAPRERAVSCAWIVRCYLPMKGHESECQEPVEFRKAQT